MTFDLAVAWRIYPGVSKTPLIHSDDKFQLVTTSLRSFLQSTARLRVKYYIILDGCSPTYRALIQALLAGEAFEVIETDHIGNWGTFALQVDILTKQTDADLVYFAEDDYLYQPDNFHQMVDLIRDDPAVDFVTPYFSLDYFYHPIHTYQHDIKYHNNKVWMSAASTCLTFLTRKAVLEQTSSLFLTYSKGNNDCALWLVLTKTHVFNPFRYWKYFRLADKECFNIMKMAVKYSFRYFFTTRRYTLWTSYPGIGTHLEKGLIPEPETWIDLARQIDATQQ